MELTQKDKKLIQIAKKMLHPKKLSGGMSGFTSWALKTKKGKIFTGLSLDLSCGVGDCAENSAIANMISHSKETKIKTIVAVQKEGIVAPCGRCRVLMNLIDKTNIKETKVIISKKEKVSLNFLLPNTWTK